MKQFKYDMGEVTTDIWRYLGSLCNGDGYGTAISMGCLHYLKQVVESVPSAIENSGIRKELLMESLPDRVRILLDGIGLLPDEEIRRRWSMLKEIYCDFVENPRFPNAACLLSGDPDYY